MGIESRDYSRDGRYTASLSGWGRDLTPVVKYLIIANVVVFLLQILLTRTATERLPDFDASWPDEEETTPDTEPPVHKKITIKAEDREPARRTHARPRGHGTDAGSHAGDAHIDYPGLVRAQPEKNHRARPDLAAGDERVLSQSLWALAHPFQHAASLLVRPAPRTDVWLIRVLAVLPRRGCVRLARLRGIGLSQQARRSPPSGPRGQSWP